jgi:hypothetical protein
MKMQNHGIPLLTSTSNNYFEYKAKLKMLILAKGLWHICDPTAPMVCRPTVKIEKGAGAGPGYVAPTAEQQRLLEYNAEALHNHEVVLIMGTSLDFAMHFLLTPTPTPPLNELGRAVYLQIDYHFSQSTEWTKQDIMA